MSSYVLPVLLSGSVPSSSGDFFAPVITNVSSGTPTSSGATITWTTDENSNSQVVYGATSAYGSSTTLHAVSVTSHSEAITGLTASTSYHYAVKSADASGNLATSDDHTFTTTGGSFDPGTLTELVGWWKTPFGSHSDGDALTTWTDASGNSNTITFSGGNAATDMLYKTNIRNGLDIVRSSGNARLGTTANAINLAAAGGSLYFVGTPAFGSAGMMADPGGSFTWFWHSAGFDYFYDAGAVHQVAGPSIDNAWHVHSATLGAATEQIGSDGVDGTGAASVGWANAVLNIPTGQGATTVWWGDIGEALICVPKLSSTDHTNVINYLKTRWGIS